MENIRKLNDHLRTMGLEDQHTWQFMFIGLLANIVSPEDWHESMDIIDTLMMQKKSA